MDRIRKALDEARRERARIVEPFPAERIERAEPAAPAPPAERAPPEPAVVSRLPDPIVYTVTRTFDPRPEVLEANRIVNPAANDRAAAAFRMLRTQILQRMNEHSWRSLAVLSAGRDEGKTTTSINLALSLASDHRQTVLLADCDLRRPSVASRLGIVPEVGLDDVLAGRARIEQCLYHPSGFDRLVILPARAPMDDSSENLAGPRGRELAMELRNRYPDRLVIFDLPPVLSADDALAFLPSVECALVVVAEGATSRQDLLRCMELTRRTPIVGTVLNRASGVSSAYG
jgi:protein-tyrosine kinase